MILIKKATGTYFWTVGYVSESVHGTTQHCGTVLLSPPSVYRKNIGEIGNGAPTVMPNKQ
jgi:hypothetical protein